MANTKVTQELIADDAIGAAQLASNAVVTASIANDAVTSAKLDTNLAVAGSLTIAGTVTANAGVNIDNISIDGTTMALSSGDLLLDVAGNIALDADGGQIKLSDAGTQIGLIQMDSGSNLIFRSMVSDEDMLFKGNDGGSTITALTLDMSAAGAATFNGTVISPLIDAAIVDGANFKVNGGQGSDGQVLTSTGSGVAWEAAAGTTINNNADNRVISGSGTANTLNGEANLTFTGSILQVVGSANVTRVGPIGQGSGAVQSWNVGTAANTFFAPNGNNTVMNPTGTAVAGAIIQVEIAMGSTVYAIAWQNKYKFGGDGTTPSVTATANKTDIFTFRYNGTVWQEIGRVQNLAQTV